MRTPDSSLVTNLQAWIGFGTAFGFGWLLHRQLDLIRMMERRWLLNSVLAVVLIAASFFLAIANGAPSPQVNYGITKLAGAVCYALAIWTTTFAAIGLALALPVRLQRHAPLSRRRLLLALSDSPADPDGAAGRGLGASTGHGRSNSRPSWLIALPLMFASYQWLVRYSFIGTVLNGRRERRERTAVVTTADLATA